jgi:hypothetical protein
MNELFLEIGWVLAAVALTGAAYALLAALLVGRFMRREPRATDHSPAVTILKPLHQGEPDLLQNLETFFTQAYAGPVQIVFGARCRPGIRLPTPPSLPTRRCMAPTPRFQT